MTVTPLYSATDCSIEAYFVAGAGSVLAVTGST
jgi:hypothetical protein